MNRYVFWFVAVFGGLSFWITAQHISDRWYAAPTAAELRAKAVHCKYWAAYAGLKAVQYEVQAKREDRYNALKRP